MSASPTLPLREDTAMPLPTGDQAWPPAELAFVTGWYNAWSAWYSGNPDQLQLTAPDDRLLRGVRHHAGRADGGHDHQRPVPRAGGGPVGRHPRRVAPR